MTPKSAEAKLKLRAARLKGKPGPTSLAFTITEKQAVEALAGDGATLGFVAGLAGLSTKQFAEARERDDKLAQAWIAGLAREETRVNRALLKTALDPSNPRQVQAGVTIKKDRHGYKDGKGASFDLGVTVNNTTQTIEPRIFARMMREMNESGTVIEHKADEQRLPHKVRDPVSAALKQRERVRED